MPVSAGDLAKLGKHATSLWLKNDPIDQIAKERPFLECLMGNKKTTGMGSDFIRETLRKDYQSNFQWYYGDDAVTYNKRDTLEEAKFDYGSVHDGFTLHEDDFVRAGLTVTDETNEPVTANEKVIIKNLFDEQMTVLKEGFEEKLDYQLHLDGTQDANAVAGLDAIVALDGQGTFGSIDSAAAGNNFWQNNFSLVVAQANLLEEMELMYTAITKYKGRVSKILMGPVAIATYRAASKADLVRQVNVNANGQQASLDAGLSGLSFKGVPIVLDHTTTELQADTAAATSWENRIYMIDERHINYKPIRGHDMVARNPEREHDKYVHYWGVTHKFALTTNKRRVHGVMSVA
jgi:hypothetical protein